MPVAGDNTTFWFSARVALGQAIQGLGLRRGDRVALPAFACGSELEPFLLAGLQPQFFGVTDELDPDPESFDAAVEGAAAALVTHYFGRPADLSHVRAACRQRGVRLIEDAAHALYSEAELGAGDEAGPLGWSADAAVYSFPKLLPVPDGGALVMGAEFDAVPAAREPAPADVVSRRLRRQVGLGLRSSSQPWLRAAVRFALDRRGRRAPEGSEGEPEGGVEEESQDELYDLIRCRSEWSQCGMSRTSARLLGSADHASVARLRREHAAHLAEVLSDRPAIRPAIPRWPRGAVPLFLPITVDDPLSLRRHMAARAIGVKHIWPYRHPAVPWERFPREAWLKQNLLGLPVHQSLGEHGRARLGEALRGWSGT